MSTYLGQFLGWCLKDIVKISTVFCNFLFTLSRGLPPEEDPRELYVCHQYPMCLGAGLQTVYEDRNIHFYSRYGHLSSRKTSAFIEKVDLRLFIYCDKITKDYSYKSRFCVSAIDKGKEEFLHTKHIIQF